MEEAVIKKMDSVMPLNNMIYGISRHKVIYDSENHIADLVFSYINRGFEKQTGLVSDAVIGKSISEVISKHDYDWPAVYKELYANGQADYSEVYSASLDKYLTVSMFHTDETDCFITWYDITSKHDHREQIIRLNGLFEIVSNINRMLIEVKTRKELFRRVCDIIVGHKDFELVWIGENNPETHAVNILAFAGMHTDYVKSLEIYSDKRTGGFGPVGTSIREDRPVVDNGFNKSDISAPWYNQAKKADIKSVVAVPIKYYGTVFGALTVYSSKNNFFKDEELRLLNEISASIAFGLEQIDKEEKRKKFEENTVYLSYHDVTTGLYNRRFFLEEIQRIDDAEFLPITVILGDVNGLKLVNDAFGHRQGDELLTIVSSILRQVCSGNVVARIGGDEFVIILPNTAAKKAEILSEEIQANLSIKFINGINISLSLGWDTKLEASQDIHKVLKNAEDNLYRNKIFARLGRRSNAIHTVLNTLHEKYPREEQHSKRVSELCQNIGKAMGLSLTELAKLETAGLMHDIGKIAIDENILNKKGRLTELERLEINRHALIGYRIIGGSYDISELSGSVLHHHERWDGHGYPDSIKGEQIPLASRIIAVADAYDAMTSERPYRKPMAEKDAVKEIVLNAGKQFDPLIAEVFVKEVLHMQWTRL